MLTIDSYSHATGPTVFYTAAFRVVLEDHMTFFRTHQRTTMLRVTGEDAYRFEGDLFGLLKFYDVQDHHQWIVMRMNNMTSPADYDGLTLEFLLPDGDALELIRNTYMSQSKLKK